MQATRRQPRHVTSWVLRACVDAYKEQNEIFGFVDGELRKTSRSQTSSLLSFRPK